jgi:hypothetical protein
MSEVIKFTNLPDIATHFRKDLTGNNTKLKDLVLLFAHNGTGKTRLSMEFKEAGKVYDEENNVTSRDTLYFNAFTEDLFSWYNDFDNDTERYIELNTSSAFFDGLLELELDAKIESFFQNYVDLKFNIDYEAAVVRFSRSIIVEEAEQTIENIKISRGEETLFIWCFFLAICQLVIDKDPSYNWVKYIYIDDPVSSLDDNNTIAIAHHLGTMLKKGNGDVKSIVSTHHALFFNVVCNELGNNAPRLFLSKSDGVYFLKDTTDSPFFYHVSMIQDLQKAINSDKIYTYHFYFLRTILEKAANFHGFNGFSDCIIIDDDEEEKKLFTRMVNNLNHGGYSMFEPKEMGEENKKYFKQIFKNFRTNYKFNEDLLEKPIETATA